MDTKFQNLIPYIFSCLFILNFNLSAQEFWLKSGELYQNVISDAELHEYKVELKNGMAVIGSIQQNDIEILIDIYDPKGLKVQTIDIRERRSRTSNIDFTSNYSGLYTFKVHPAKEVSDKGNYILQIDQILSTLDNAKRIAKKEIKSESIYVLWEKSLSDSLAIDDFIKNQTVQHIIEPIEGNDKEMLVTYFCIPDEHTEYVMQSGGPDFLGLRLHQLGNTKLHFTSQVVPVDARFNYGFNYFKVFKAGLNNEVIKRDVIHAYDGIVEMPKAPTQPFIVKNNNIPEGKLEVVEFQSEHLKETRKITVHIPATYSSATSHNLLIVFDGEAYGARPGRNSRIPTHTILDNLFASNKITPTITLLVWSMGKRSEDLINDDFGDFIAEELIPWARSNYNISPGGSHVILAGSSRGGFASSYIAFRHSEVIGNVLSQSGSYWIKGTENENHWIYPEDNGKLINLYKSSERLSIKFYMDVGLYDAGASMLGMNRQFRDILELKGYEVDYHEFKGGHSYINWQGTLSDGLISLIGNESK
ncbi:alpha/beta hydrolase [Marinigracilibium pacificum]|uniref:Esterase family protein n=1 Tax=Marinigracilibium pacificum TaxID=2729599 RepID=A0A848ITJ6_9BACT|nr:alpha/beta hydrolase-fold protein [Marinigracilibium pacificum]NMM47803.1 esterase family protein [Marinigracilibium pacificum]